MSSKQLGNMILEFKGEVHAGNNTFGYCQMIVEANGNKGESGIPYYDSVRYRIKKSEPLSLHMFLLAVRWPYLVSL